LWFVATHIDCNRKRESGSFDFNHSLKSNYTITNFSFSFSFLFCLVHLKEENIEIERKTMTDDDRLDIYAMNDSSASDFPAVTLSTIEKGNEQHREEYVNNQVDFFSFKFFVKIIYQLL
jgi:hypothetical protein